MNQVPVYKFIGKVTGAPTRSGTFRVYCENDGKTYTIIPSVDPVTEVSNTPNVWIGDTIMCGVTIYDANSLLIYGEVDVVVVCDHISFITCISRAVPGLGTFKINELYKHIKKGLKGDVTPYDVLSRYASKFSDPVKRKDCEGFINEISVLPGKGNEPVMNRVQVQLLLQWWNNMYDRHRLETLNVTDEELKDSDVGNYELYRRLVKNSYAVPCVSILRCPAIDAKNGRDKHPLDEDCGKILRYVFNGVKRGHSCTELSVLRRAHPAVSRPEIRERLISDFRLVFEDIDVYPENDDPPEKETLVYCCQQNRVEKNLADFVIERVTSPLMHRRIVPVYHDTALDSDQRAAIDLSLNSNISIIDGSAGSGKTRTVRTLIKNLELAGLSYVVTSFTGKAVIRAKELNGIGDRAATMHRMIVGGYNPGEFDVMIMDESTMTNNWLFWAFIKKFTHRFSVVMIGDTQQLPPIEWGSFFNSCVMSRSVPRTSLTSNHRTVSEDGTPNGIIINATRITQWPEGKIFPFEEMGNFIISKDKMDVIDKVITSFKRNGVKAEEVTIVTPYVKMKKPNGEYDFILSKLNRLCQLVWNRDNRHIEVGERSFYVGDRVMLTENNYDIDVFNGQEGLVVDFTEDEVHVNFKSAIIRKKGTITPMLEGDYIKEMVIEKVEDLDDARSTEDCRMQSDEAQTGTGSVKDCVSQPDERVYIRKIVRVPLAKGKRRPRSDKFGQDSVSYLDTSLLDLSFALSIHKSQGSEWPYTLFYIPTKCKTNTSFANRNLAYVALTRGGRMMMMIDRGCHSSQIIANGLPYRCEGLTSRLMKGLPRIREFKEKIIDKKAFECTSANNDYDYDVSDDDY